LGGQPYAPGRGLEIKKFSQAVFKAEKHGQGKVMLEVIEVQLGEYLAEDDIVCLRGRFWAGVKKQKLKRQVSF